MSIGMTSRTCLHVMPACRKRPTCGSPSGGADAMPASETIVWPGFSLADYAPASPRPEMAIGLA